MDEYVGLLPKKYDANKLETETKSFWEKNSVYEMVKKTRENQPKFYFLDGPPFPSSDTPHIGTCWNKVLKDTVIRYKRSRGFNVRDQPGYDCHGLPIELAIEQKFGVKTKKEIEMVGLERFITACREFVEFNSQSMTNIFRDLGVWMNWSKPYMTHDDEYIESDWWSLKHAWINGLFEHSQRVVHWCPRCETVLSDYEVVLEYKILRDPSIYVKFPVEGKPNEFILIWTTTPWTLPSNVAVMVNPKFEYVRARSSEEIFILAKERVTPLEQITGARLEIIEGFSGTDLENVRYHSPLEKYVPAQASLENGHRVVLSESYVTLEEGTGCVHSAPGHGEEDYEVGTLYKLPVLMLVDDQGKFLEEAGRYAGRPVKEANQQIIDDLKAMGMLLHADEIEHRSPVCWRCRTPLITRATAQWIIRVAQLRDRFIKEIDSTLWIPGWAGASQFKNWLQNLKDWVISRQRFWGTPLPVWICTKCKTPTVIGSKDELLKNSLDGQSEIVSLHIPWVDSIKLGCKCGGEMKRIPDVMVGWYDSGAASYACLGHPKNSQDTAYWWPADFIVEGRDQISGWFFSLLKAGIVSLDRMPYRTVLMHGFMLDDKGREMHKSLGNFVTPQEVVEKFGRDAFRYYVLQSTIWEDLKFSWDTVKQYSGDLDTFWNTYVFASTYMNLDKFNPSKWPIDKLAKTLRPEDRWLLSRTHRTIKEVTKAMDDYKVHEAIRGIKSFLVDDLSHTYVRYIRRRTWVESQTRDKLSAYATLYFALRSVLVMLAQIAPFQTEAIYQHMFRNSEPSEAKSVHQLDWPKYIEKLIDDDAENEMIITQAIISTAALARSQKSLKQRQPVRQILIATDSTTTRKALRRYSTLLADQSNSRLIKIINPSREAQFTNEKYVNRYTSTKFSDGTLYIDLKLTREDLAEGLARDVVRRIQQMRKEMDLKVDSHIHAYVITSEDGVQMLRSKRKYITKETRAKKMVLSTKKPSQNDGYYWKSWEIGKEKFEFGLQSVSKA